MEEVCSPRWMGLCFRHKNISVVESAWVDRKQKLKSVDFDEIPRDLDSVDAFQLEELRLEETQGASSSLSINATHSHSNAHRKETEEPSSRVSKHTTLNKVQDNVAIETSSFGKNHAIHSTVHGNESASNQGAQHKGSAKSRLYETCAAFHWEPPSFICCKDEGPSHNKLFTFKVTVQVEDATRTALECFSEPRSKKRVAAEHAAEGALWCLQHLGYKI